MDLIIGLETLLDLRDSRGGGSWGEVLHELVVKLSESLAALLKSRAKFALQEAILGGKEKVRGN